MRAIFNWYLEGQPVIRIVERCAGLGWRNKQWTTKEGKVYGGYGLRRCQCTTCSPTRFTPAARGPTASSTGPDMSRSSTSRPSSWCRRS